MGPPEPTAVANQRTGSQLPIGAAMNKYQSASLILNFIDKNVGLEIKPLF